MIKRHLVLIGLSISLTFLLTAIANYPGGTYQDKKTVGFDWSRNYISNLFEAKAVNGADNASRTWAFIGMFFYSMSCAVFFINMAEKMSEKNAKNILKYTGILTMPFTFLIITPWHDLMLTVSSFLFWTCIVCITVLIFKTNLLFFKIYNIICLVIFYYAVYLHATNNGDLLPLVQKINNISTIFLILGLEYFSHKEDFVNIKPQIDNEL